MILFLCSQDIGRMEAAIEDHGRVVSSCLAVPPELFLPSLHALLKEWNVDLKSLERVVVVSGPGSFTGTRMIVTIGNAIAFAQNIPVLGIPNPERLDLKPLIETGAWTTLSTDQPFASPVYDRPANITNRRSEVGGGKWKLGVGRSEVGDQ